jgi:hypothetical protein
VVVLRIPVERLLDVLGQPGSALVSPDTKTARNSVCMLRVP